MGRVYSLGCLGEGRLEHLAPPLDPPLAATFLGVHLLNTSTATLFGNHVDL